MIITIIMGICSSKASPPVQAQPVLGKVKDDINDMPSLPDKIINDINDVPILVACRNNDVELFNHLVNVQKINLKLRYIIFFLKGRKEIKTQIVTTPFSEAYFSNSIEIVKLLLNIPNYININEEFMDERNVSRYFPPICMSPLTVACLKKYDELIKLFVNHGAQIYPKHLYDVCRNGNLDAVELFLKHGVKISVDVFLCLAKMPKNENNDKIRKMIFDYDSDRRNDNKFLIETKNV